VVVVVGLTAAAGQRLYLARHCAVRSVERARLFWVAGAAAVATLVVREALDLRISDVCVGLFAAICVALLVAFRSGFRHWLGIQRRRGSPSAAGRARR